MIRKIILSADSPQTLAQSEPRAAQPRRPARVAWNPVPGFAGGILVATASHDRKIRIWEVPDARWDKGGYKAKRKDGPGGAEKQKGHVNPTV